MTSKAQLIALLTTHRDAVTLSCILLTTLQIESKITCGMPSRRIFEFWDSETIFPAF